MSLTLDEVIEQVKQWVIKKKDERDYIYILRDYVSSELPVELRDVFFLPDKVITMFSYGNYVDGFEFIVMVYHESGDWVITNYTTYQCSN